MTGLIGALITALLVFIASTWQRKAVVGKDGWKRLRASWLEHFILVLAGALSYVAGYIVVFGSSREDAAAQNLFAMLLLLCFSGGFLFIFWLSYLQKVEWKGGQIKTQTIRFFSVAKKRRFSEILETSDGAGSGEYKIKFRDGSRLWVPTMSRGAKEFYASIPDRAKIDE